MFQNFMIIPLYVIPIPNLFHYRENELGILHFLIKISDADIMMGALVQSARLLSYVCVPSMFQKVVARCVGDTADLSVYAKNRERFYHALTEMGYECAEPGGAFLSVHESTRG